MGPRKTCPKAASKKVRKKIVKPEAGDTCVPASQKPALGKSSGRKKPARKKPACAKGSTVENSAHQKSQTGKGSAAARPALAAKCPERQVMLGQTPPRLPNKNVIRVASDCSGLCPEGRAAATASSGAFACQHAFASEKCPKKRSLGALGCSHVLFCFF